MASHILVASGRTGQLWQPREEGRRGLIQSSRGVRQSQIRVLAGEVGGNWSDETQAFLRQLAKARARSEPVPQQARARAAWLMRWRAILACSSAWAFATSLLEVRAGGGCDGQVVCSSCDDRCSQQCLSITCHFKKNTFIPATLSSDHFHPKTTFIPTTPSSDRFHPKTTFIQNHFHPNRTII